MLKMSAVLLQLPGGSYATPAEEGNVEVRAAVLPLGANDDREGGVFGVEPSKCHWGGER